MKTEILEFLKTVSVLDQLESGELERLSEVLLVREVQPNEVIVREGESADAMFFVFSGAVNASEEIQSGDGEAVQPMGAPLHTFSQGDLFGEMAFFDERPRSASVTAVKPTVLLVLSYKNLEKLIHFDGVLASRLFQGFIRNLCARVRTTNDGVRLLYQRLVKYDAGLWEILQTYAGDQELRHLFRKLVY